VDVWGDAIDAARHAVEQEENAHAAADFNAAEEDRTAVMAVADERAAWDELVEATRPLAQKLEEASILRTKAKRRGFFVKPIHCWPLQARSFHSYKATGAGTGVDVDQWGVAVLVFVVGGLEILQGSVVSDRPIGKERGRPRPNSWQVRDLYLVDLPSVDEVTQDAADLFVRRKSPLTDVVASHQWD
jgi:hypothetical protein